MKEETPKTYEVRTRWSNCQANDKILIPIGTTVEIGLKFQTCYLCGCATLKYQSTNHITQP